MRTVINIRFLTLIILLGFGLNATSQEIIDSYLTEAASNNPGLKSKFNDYLAALEKIPQVGTLPDPQLMFKDFILPVETKAGPQKVRISATQMFPWFGTLGAMKDVATEMAKSKYELFEETKSKLFYDVKSTYYNLYFTQKAIDITKTNIGILNTFRKLALIKVESGMASAVDVLRVEMEIADLENQLALLRDNFFTLSVEFNNLLNVDGNRSVDIPVTLGSPDIEFSREAILDSISSGNHQVLQLEFMEASFMRQQKVAKKMGKPDFSVGFDYIVVGKGSVSSDIAGKDATIFPMVGISVPLYRHKYTAMVHEAVLMQEATEYEKMDRINVLESTFEKSNKDYSDASRRIPLYTSQNELALKAMNLLQTEYATSGNNFEEILRMERQVLMYSLELEKARSDKNASIAFINYLMGK